MLEAEILIRKRDLRRAEALLTAANSSELPRDVIANRKILHAYALCLLNRTTEANAAFVQAEAVVDKSDQRDWSELEYFRGLCEYPVNKENALRRFGSSAEWARGLDNYLQARALGAVGFTLMQQSHYDEAIEKLSTARSITRSEWLLQDLLGDLGECYQHLGEWKTAKSFLEQAEGLAARMPDAASHRVTWLIDLGQQHYSQLEYVDAEKSWKDALAVAAQLGESDAKGRCLTNLAVLAIRSGNTSSAADYIREAEQLQLRGDQELYIVLSKAELASLQRNDAEAESLLNRILEQTTNPQLKYEAATDLGKIYARGKRVQDAERMFQMGIATAEHAFEQIRSDQYRISFFDYNPFYDPYVNFLVGQNRPVDALKIAERGRSRALASGLGLNEGNRSLDLNAIQSQLARGEQTVLAYWLTPNESYLWLLTRSRLQLFKLPPEMEIANAVDVYSKDVEDIHLAEDARLGQKLYGLLIAPAEKYIPKNSNVVIIPHRRLYKLNFETLVAPAPAPHFWIEDVCIQNASFLGVLAASGRRQVHFRKDLLLMGAPVEASKDFPVLTHAPEELQKVAAHFAPGEETVIDGKQAIPAAYNSSDPRQFRFFHFVTHGTASDASPLDSAIILSPSNDGFKLYARKIIESKINPELVTISTCYGAGTRQYSGEGLVGLAWAFMRAGAHQVVAALWEVDDAANADFMDQFYSELTHGKTAAVALRDSKLAMLHSTGPRKRPYYWASLQLYTGP